MRPPILLGVVLAVVVIALTLLAPFIGTGDARATRRAQALAAQSRAELVRISAGGDALRSSVDAEHAKADPEKIAKAVETAAEAFKRSAAEGQKSLSAAQQLAQRTGYPAPQVALPAANAASVTKAFGEFEQGLKSDATLLTAALNDAKAAVGEKADAIGAQYAVGQAEYQRAVEALLASEALRTQQEALQSELLGVAAQWKASRATADELNGLHTAPVLDRLRSDLTEFAQKKSDANGQFAELQKQLAARKESLARVDADLKEARTALLEHEKKSFHAGDDASFDAYRRTYEGLSARLSELQTQEHQLRFGGQVGDDAKAAGGGAAAGGREIVPLAVLQQNHDIAETRAKQLSTANVELENQIKYLADLGERAQQEASRIEQRLAELGERQKALLKQIDELAGAALAKEDIALKAANAAAAAFGSEQQSINAVIAQARDAQSRDTQQKNERLRALLRDQYLPQVGASAQAASQLLAGRVAAQRVECGTRVLADMQVFAQLNPDPSFAFNPTPFEDLVKAAREGGIQTLDKARASFQKLSSQPSATAWAPLGALAAAQHLSARIDTAKAEQYRADALATIEKAVDKREQSPYVASLVAFRNHLRGAPAATESAPGATESAPPTEGDKPAEGAPPKTP